MFYPQTMTETELIVPAKDLLAVTKVLAGQGIFHQVDASYLSSEAQLDSTDSWQGRAAVYAGLERRILAAMQALDLKEGPPPPVERAEMIEIEAVRPLVEQTEQEVQKASEQVAKEQKRLEQRESHLRQLEPIAGINLDIGALRNPRYIFSMLGIIPIANLARLRTSLVRTPYVLLTLRQDNRTAVVWLAGAKRNADILGRAARSAYLNPLDLPDVHQGTPAEIIQSLHTATERAHQHIAEQQATLTGLREARKGQLQTLLWRVRASRMLANAMARYGKLRYTYVIIGWVPSARLADLKQRLKAASGDILIDAYPPIQRGAQQHVPVALHNPGILHAFQQLVTTYARPQYEEVDPTWLITLTFPLLFGAMFGDVGHGAVLALLGGLVASRKIKALRGLANLGTIIVACGLMATLFGFLYGSLFGLEKVFPALWMRPMDNIMQILMVAIGAGVVLLSIGFLLGILNAWRKRDWGQLLFDHNGVAGLVLYWSLIGLAATVFVSGFPVRPLAFAVPAALAGLAVMLSELLKRLVDGRRPLTDGGIGDYAIESIFELFETLISLLSNSLSYVRVGAFAVAHGGLSAVVFILADLASPSRGVGYWIVIALGSLFIIGFEGLIVGIQTMRLEYYEFFSKFFTGGGMPYKPLTVLPAADE